MEKQELIEIGKEIMNKNYCNGITIDYDKIIESNDSVKFYLDFLLPKRITDINEEHTFYIRLKNVGLISINKRGKLINKSSPEEFVVESIERYKELIEQREKFIIKLFTKQLIKVEQVHISLTPLRKVIRKFKENDFRIDNLKRNFNDNEIKYIKVLNSFGYIRNEEENYTLDNEMIKRLEDVNDIKSREESIKEIITAIFSEHFTYIISELQNNSIVPFIGIITTLSNLTIELNKNIRLSLNSLYQLYKEHYISGQDLSGFEDKIIDMKNVNLIDYDEKNKMISLPKELFDNLILRFKTTFNQTQLAS